MPRANEINARSYLPPGVAANLDDEEIRMDCEEVIEHASALMTRLRECGYGELAERASVVTAILRGLRNDLGERT